MSKYGLYLLDTHVLLWFLDDNKNLPNSIKEDIEYFQNQYEVSFMSIFEIVTLVELRKIKIGMSIKDLLTKIATFGINVRPVSGRDFMALESLPYKANNQDPFDRVIISQSIAANAILISADSKFPQYVKHGLNLLQIPK
jgi:PIN domain nuclease of toxin-antitoxin system